MRLPSLDELIAAELGLNPGRRVLGKASREAVDGDDGPSAHSRSVETRPVQVEAYLDCLGPSSVTVTSGSTVDHQSLPSGRLLRS